MFIHRKEIGRWPALDSYEADGCFVEELTRQHSYQVVDSRPLVFLPKSSCGVPNAETRMGGILAKLTTSWLYRKKQVRLKLFGGRNGTHRKGS